MSAFLPSDIPPAINTYERLFSWCAMALRSANPTIGVLEQQDTTQRVCQVGMFDAADGTRRQLIRISLPFDPSYEANGSSQDFWMFAEEISNTAIPAGFKG